MSYTLKGILEIATAADRPSIKMAELVVQQLEAGKEVSNFFPDTFLESYFDEGYTPNFAEIQRWAQERSEDAANQMSVSVQDKFLELTNPSSPQFKALDATLEQLFNEEIDSDEAIRTLSALWTWMDDSSIWGGTPVDSHWHTTKINAALLKLSQVNMTVIDAATDNLQEVLGLHTFWIESVGIAHPQTPKIEHVEEVIERSKARLRKAKHAREELTEYCVKLGFLFRDAWWIENHGRMTIRGYLAQQTALRAGEGGAKQSSAARLKRIRIFMSEHARIVAQNPLLREDPPEKIAHRALKEAIKKDPETFKTGKSRKIAVEYWEDVRADDGLFQEYKNVLETYS